MQGEVVVALVGGAAIVTSTSITSLLSYLAAREARRQVTPSNGVPTAHMIEELKSDMKGIKTDLQYHVTVQHGRGPIEDQKETP
jgi:hypothetical protein